MSYATVADLVVRFELCEMQQRDPLDAAAVLAAGAAGQALAAASWDYLFETSGDPATRDDPLALASDDPRRGSSAESMKAASAVLWPRTVAALADAAAVIDSSISARYALPLATGPWPLLRSMACDLARARLYDDASVEQPRKMEKRALALLAAIAKGDVRLADASGAEPTTRNHPRITDVKPRLTRENLESF